MCFCLHQAETPLHKVLIESKLAALLTLLNECCNHRRIVGDGKLIVLAGTFFYFFFKHLAKSVRNRNHSLVYEILKWSLT